MARVRTCLLVFLCVVVGSAFGQVASLCRPNERLLACGGCQKTCKDPAPDCAGVCRFGCYCDGDEVRNETGHCVKLADCPPISPTYKEDTSEPRSTSECPPNEEYRFCEPCNPTCDNPHPICPAQCSRGCFCQRGLVRNREGLCVELKDCTKDVQDNLISEEDLDIPIIFHMTCGRGQVYKICSPCERTCANLHPICPAQCHRGCACRDGLVRAPSGECVEVQKCPYNV